MVPGPGWSRAGSRTRPGGSHEDPVLLCPAGSLAPFQHVSVGRGRNHRILGGPGPPTAPNVLTYRQSGADPHSSRPPRGQQGGDRACSESTAAEPGKPKSPSSPLSPGDPGRQMHRSDRTLRPQAGVASVRPSRDGRPGRGGCPRAQPLRPSRPRVTPLPHVTAPGQTLRPGPEAHSQNCAEDEPARPARPPQTRPLVSWVSLRSMPGWRGEQEVGHPNHSSRKPPRERLRVRGRFLRPEVPVYGGGRARPLPLTLTAGFA